MTTYARVVGGFAADVVVSPPTLAERFNADWLAKQTFYVAPDDTLTGRAAVVNQDGSVTWGANPVAPVEPVIVDTESLLEQGVADRNSALLFKANALLRKGDVAGAQLLMNQMEK